MPSDSDTTTFTHKGVDFTITRAQYNSLSSDEQSRVQQGYLVSQGKVIGTKPGGNFWKRWKGLFGDPKGYEFRPLRTADYGYPDDTDFAISTGMWAFQTIGNFNVGILPGFMVLGASMLINDFVLPQFKMGTGSSFVFNMQGGFNLYHYMFGKGKIDPWVKWPAIFVILNDVAAVGVEYYRDFDFNTMMGHDVHLAGLLIGCGMGMVSKRLM